MISSVERIVNSVWGPFPTDPKERKLLFKIDWFVLSFSCLIYWVNYVDRLNVSNAYVSGMQEDLNMKGNEFNIINTCFSVGYILFLVPNNLVLLKIRPRYWLTFCALSWGLLTLGIYRVTSYKQICAIRFFQGAFESSTFSGVHLILGSWYKENELAKRSAIFTLSGLIGNIFSSVMQSSIYKNMDQKSNIAGWRWLFIIDFIITVPIALYGFVFFPDTPETCKAFYFSEEELQLAKSRTTLVKPRFDLTILKRVVGRWHWWFFSLLWALGGENESYATNSLFALWLKYFGYSIPQRNYYPMGVYAVGVVATLIAGFYIDKTKARYHWRAATFIGISMIVSTIMLLVRPFSDKVVFAAHYISGISYSGQAVVFAWANVVCHYDLEERSVVLGSMNMFSSAVNAWWSILFYAADKAPKFRMGCWAMLATSSSSIVVLIIIRYLQKREVYSKKNLGAWSSDDEESNDNDKEAFGTHIGEQ